MSARELPLKHINIKVAAQAPDYHDRTLRVLHTLEVKLDGGHYEPLSQRDCALAGALRKMLETYERELCTNTAMKLK